MVDKWVDLCSRNTGKWEQYKLDEAIKKSDLTITQLPIEYCQIFDFPVQGKDVVIRHYQESRNR